MIQAFYQALQTSVSWERVSEIQSTKETLTLQQLKQTIIAVSQLDNPRGA